MELVGCDHLHVGQQISGIFFRACNASLYLAAGHADLVNQLTVLRDEWVAR
ncbi:hypothetical protein D3C75_1321150 [compost metagenome]